MTIEMFSMISIDIHVYIQTNTVHMHVLRMKNNWLALISVNIISGVDCNFLELLINYRVKCVDKFLSRVSNEVTKIHHQTCECKPFKPWQSNTSYSYCFHVVKRSFSVVTTNRTFFAFAFDGFLNRY